MLTMHQGALITLQSVSGGQTSEAGKPLHTTSDSFAAERNKNYREQWPLLDTEKIMKGGGHITVTI